jgi:hypothetical protein
MSLDPLAIAARGHLRAHREGVLIADGTAHTIRFIIDSATGLLVFPATPATADAFELVLFIPREDPDGEPELQLLLSPSRVDPDRDQACDRWRAYHGEPRLTRWLACAIESARFVGAVVESGPLTGPNPLHAAETALCRILNADSNRLAALCQTQAGVAPREPTAVGVDDTGIDVRARFGIIRIGFPQPQQSAAEAETLIRSLLEHPEP